MENAVRRPGSGPRIAVAQFSPVLGDLKANLETHKKLIAQALEQGVDILVFPELSLTGYRLKDTVPDVALERTSETMTELAELSKDISLVVGLVEETRDHCFYNASVFFEAGRVLSVHRKVYLPTYGMFDEQRYFARGQRIQAFNSRHGRIALLICEDMLHPSAAMVAGLDGASIVIVPSASPVVGVNAGAKSIVGTAGKKAAKSEDSNGQGPSDDSAVKPDAGQNGQHWENWNRAMARNLGLYVVHANRCGNEDGHVYWGGSSIIDPSGAIITRAALFEDDLISAPLGEDSVRRRRLKNPLLRDEDMDLVINEYSRLRERPVLKPAHAGRDAGRRDDRRDDRREGGGGGFKRDDRREGGGG
ncbi:MAG TPA: hypothetical protein EYG16_07355, partial [Deltaproteobacteria bacterium]|nr:hypothetical protein [Deltaproteobacteria bacterium]